MPTLHVIAGPNGAGKTTFAREYLPLHAACKYFVNADLIAQGVSPFSPEAAAFRAGRLMLDEIHRLARQRVDFGFETTLSGRAHMRLIRRLKKQGYSVHLYFLWVTNVALALSRVKDRVAKGGHNVPEAVVRRRFARALRNFFGHYRGLADVWLFFDNSWHEPRVVARGENGGLDLLDRPLFERLASQYEGT
jgi:predicted ABC-type ATPase